jgi:hypothetical protein
MADAFNDFKSRRRHLTPAEKKRYMALCRRAAFTGNATRAERHDHLLSMMR